MMEGTVIFCGGACGLNCVFCPVRGERAAVPAAEIKKAIAKAAKRVILAGGDPLLRKDIAELAAFARSRRLKVSLASNGRMLLYPGLRAALLAAGVDSFIITPLAGDAATRTRGAFVQALAATRELLKLRGVAVEARAPVLRGSDLGAGRLIPGCAVSFYYPPPGKPAQLFLPPDEAPAGCAGLPPCLLGQESLATEVSTCLGLPRPQDFARPLLCSECAREASCRGVPHKSFDAVRPFKEVRSNSFEYTFARELRGFRPRRKACPGPALLKGCLPERAVYLRREKTISLYSADTSSFTDGELRGVKYFREQLYLDISGKPMLDDFQNDVRQLEMQEPCRDCARKERCGVCYAAKDEIPFEREERWLRQEIRRLDGRVLDIGCGDLRFYEGAVAKLLAEDKIEYHGIDVDARALAKLKKRHPLAHVHRAPIESFSFPGGYFDYVFALRSLNHFQDLEKAFSAMTALVKDFGMVVIAECLPFGLLRSRRQTQRARSAPGPGFEHFRNWSSEQVLEFIRRKKFPLKLNTHRPVRPGTSNQWILKLIKIPDE